MATIYINRSHLLLYCSC